MGELEQKDHQYTTEQRAEIQRHIAALNAAWRTYEEYAEDPRAIAERACANDAFLKECAWLWEHYGISDATDLNYNDELLQFSLP